MPTTTTEALVVHPLELPEGTAFGEVEPELAHVRPVTHRPPATLRRVAPVVELAGQQQAQPESVTRQRAESAVIQRTALVAAQQEQAPTEPALRQQQPEAPERTERLIAADAAVVVAALPARRQ